MWRNAVRGWMVIGLAVGVAVGALAGTPVEWKDLPKAVQDRVLEYGGKPGTIDREGFKIDDKVVYEAQIKGKDGVVRDLVITEDGKLRETKTDDEANQQGDPAARLERAKKIIARAKFSRPREIDNPWLPLAKLKIDVLEGKEGGNKIRIERVAKPEIHKQFKIGEQTVDSLAVEDSEFEDGKLIEKTIDYFVQDDEGTVYYLGEGVDEYQDGKVVGHEGAWMLGKDTEAPGIIVPGNPKIGDKFKSEDVSDAIHEDDEVVSVSESVEVPAGKYANCIKIKELLAEGDTEYKYYAKGVGVVREVPADGDVLLVRHEEREGGGK